MMFNLWIVIVNVALISMVLIILRQHWTEIKEGFQRGRQKEQQRALAEAMQKAYSIEPRIGFTDATISVNEARERLELPPLQPEAVLWTSDAADQHRPVNEYFPSLGKEPEPEPPEPALLDQERKRKITLR
jgi:hypothetical protein